MERFQDLNHSSFDGWVVHVDDTALLRDHGLRVTSPRLAVLDALRRTPHADADTVLRLVRAGVPSVSVQAVYDVLGALTTAGLLRRIEPAGHPARYERRVGDNHHHVVCRGCGAVDDVDCVTGHAPCLIPSSTSGFAVETAEVTFWGLCPTCAAAAAAADD
ncbi:transcriptional repressor [Cellulomonas septica]|uniref:Transcriptional repressor n=1 Tax=Cellulomonas septica TaxID=285080 RepID=A0ABX1K2N0_9CELL|nr:transcriptional repressor [Cellulomonas septica]